MFIFVLNKIHSLLPAIISANYLLCFCGNELSIALGQRRRVRLSKSML